MYYKEIESDRKVKQERDTLLKKMASERLAQVAAKKKAKKVGKND